MDDKLLLEVENLRTYFYLDQGVVKAVDGAHLQIKRGETLAVVGESGCGKSMTARSILRIVDPPGRIVDGAIRYWRSSVDANGQPTTETIDLATLRSKSLAMRSIRGKEIAMIFQEPMTSLSPLYTVGNQIAEAILLHMPVSQKEARERTFELLQRVGLPRPKQQVDAYPHQLSGGMRQRVMIAMALACNPSLLIADEPTTALDVTTQAQILDLLRDLQAQLGMAIMLITHDLGVVAEMANDVAVMYLGRVVETSDVENLFYDPQHPYTRALLRSVPRVQRQVRMRLDTVRGMVPDPLNLPPGCLFYPRCDVAIPGICDTVDPPAVPRGPGRDVRCVHYGNLESPLPLDARPLSHLHPNTLPAAAFSAPAPARTVNSNGHNLLEIKNLHMHFPIREGFLRRITGWVKAVDDVNLFIKPGETLSIVGESGCGKTTTGRCIVRAYDVSSGQIVYRHDDGSTVDLAQVKGSALRRYRREIRMIFQDPYASLNPRMNVLEIIGEPLKVHGGVSGRELEDRVAALLKRVGLRPEYMRWYPHAFSGGQRQRISIARALALNPRLVIADEAVSALDVSVRAQILNLLQDLQAEMGLTYVFIAHDLGVVEYISDRVAVMYVGHVVELADTATLYDNPRHPYTEALMSAVPKPDPNLRSERIVLQGEVADPANPPNGCYFHPRCAYARERCKVERPHLRKISAEHYSACHFAEELELRGVTPKSSAMQAV
ncbi:MAG: ABC transporter ATP-binding protein [Chloroflexales bacterium]|nr:ABC transporter ATP-binding protein [Chloroflexales bacterium]